MATAARRIPGLTKSQRQRAILELVRTSVVRTQDDIVQGLRHRHVHVTQTTVSRDIHELGLLRVHDESGAHYVAPPSQVEGSTALQRLRSAVQEHGQAVEFIGCIGVLRTDPGSAQLVAASLDDVRFDEVAGTVAGDDTVLVVSRALPAAQRLLLRLRAMLAVS